MSLWAAQFRETFYLRRYVRTVDSGRREEHGPPEPHPCRWEPGARTVRTVDGRQAVADGTLYTTAQVSPKDLLWLPGTDASDYRASRRALTTYERKDLLSGAFDHSEVVL